MKKMIFLLLISVVYLTGCTSPNNNKESVQKESTEETLVAVIDPEAAELGFPEKFISKEHKNIDWSKATPEKVSDMDVEVYDTGITVEVCGGIGCDK